MFIKEAGFVGNIDQISFESYSTIADSWDSLLLAVVLLASRLDWRFLQVRIRSLDKGKSFNWMTGMDFGNTIAVRF